WNGPGPARRGTMACRRPRSGALGLPAGGLVSSTHPPPVSRRRAMRANLLIGAVLAAVVATALADRPAAGQPPARSDEVKKLEAELARLQARVQEVEARLRKARAVVVSFTVKSARSLEDPT